MHDVDRALKERGAGGDPVEAGRVVFRPAGPPESPAPWASLDESRKVGVVEALIFAAERPVSIRELQRVLGCERGELVASIARIRANLEGGTRGLVLAEVAGGLVFRTRPEFSPWIRKLVQSRPPRLSNAALECLAIVAYQQPVTRAEVEAVRGVESGAVLRTLLEKRLVRVLGRKDDIGRPLIYGTTREFLRVFGLKNLAELPALDELNALIHAASPGEGEGGAN